MDKATAKKLANSIIDYFVKLTEFESRKDIRVFVTDTDDESELDGQYAFTRQFPDYAVFQIDLILTPSLTETDIAELIIHELVHVFTGGYERHYHLFIDESGDDEPAISWKSFRFEHERVAMRFSKIMLALWKRHTEGKK